jgi:hypothetical protein
MSHLTLSLLPPVKLTPLLQDTMFDSSFISFENDMSFDFDSDFLNSFASTTMKEKVTFAASTSSNEVKFPSRPPRKESLITDYLSLPQYPPSLTSLSLTSTEELMEDIHVDQSSQESNKVFTPSTSLDHLDIEFQYLKTRWEAVEKENDVDLKTRWESVEKKRDVNLKTRWGAVEKEEDVNLKTQLEEEDDDDKKFGFFKAPPKKQAAPKRITLHASDFEAFDTSILGGFIL